MSDEQKKKFEEILDEQKIGKYRSYFILAMKSAYNLALEDAAESVKWSDPSLQLDRTILKLKIQ